MKKRIRKETYCGILLRKQWGKKKTMECVLIKKLIRKEKFGNFARNPEHENNTETGPYI